jgi:hypothetical protein
MGVGQPAIWATLARSPPPEAVLPSSFLRSPLSGPPVGVLGVGHPEQSLSDMGRADAVCAKYCRPAGVTFSLQVCLYSIEPSVPNR